MDSNIGSRRKLAKSSERSSYLENRRRVVVAAAKVFRAHGYTQATLAQVAEELGTDRATLYYYVASKQELFQEVVTDAVVANVELAESIAIDRKVPPAERLGAIIEALMVSYEKHYPYLFVYLQENPYHLHDRLEGWPQTMAQWNRRFARALEGIIEDGLADKSFAPIGDSRTITNGIIGMVSWSHRWFSPGESMSAGEVADTFAQLVLGGLLNGAEHKSDILISGT